MSVLIISVQVFEQILVLLVIVQVILSYFMSPYHPVRQQIDALVEPFLSPIRRFVPTIGMMDFSPLVLIILVQLFGQVIIFFLSSL